MTQALPEKNCVRCGESFPPERKSQKYCGPICKRLSQKKSAPTFTTETCGCGQTFVALTGQVVCLKCREVPKAEKPKYVPSKPPKWQECPRENWTLDHYWRWVADRLREEGHAVTRFPDLRGWAQLRHLVFKLNLGMNGTRGIGLPRLIEVTEKLLERFELVRAAYSWDGPFHPGTLLGFWWGIEAKLMGNQGGFMGKCRDWSGDEDPFAQDSVPEKDYEIDLWDSEDKPKVTSPWSWEVLPEEKWRATTVWQFVTAKLNARGVRVLPMTRAATMKLRKLIEDDGLPNVIRIVRWLVNNYSDARSFYDFYEPFTAGALVAYYPGMKKYFTKVHGNRALQDLHDETKEYFEQ